MKYSKFNTLLAAAAVAVCLTIAAPAKASTIQLGFILDSSGSITSSGWSTIVSGLATAITTEIPLPGADTYEVSVVSFSSTASTIVNHVLIDSAATRTAVAAAVASASFLNANTNFSLAFSTMQGVLTSSPNSPALTYVNFATDGVPNEGGGEAGGITARDAMIAAAGVDNLSIEGIGGGVNVAYLTGSICYPLACDTVSPYNFPAQGFYIPVANAQGYADAIGNKIQVVTGRVPEPTSMFLLGSGLLLAGRRLRKRQ
ncbi:MAG TPA: vWA domain-containing protein [Vicinamibacterales bacterium]|nr:vWA domain-containing protein [Vicinamibacterales bacterium]